VFQCNNNSFKIICNYHKVQKKKNSTNKSPVICCYVGLLLCSLLFFYLVHIIVCCLFCFVSRSCFFTFRPGQFTCCNVVVGNTVFCSWFVFCVVGVVCYFAVDLFVIC